MVDALVSVVFKQIESIIVREFKEKVKLVVGVEKELQKLQSNLQAIRGVLADAEEKQLKDVAVKQWLEKLKDVAYDMDDVLDEWSTALLKLQIEGRDDHNSTFMGKVLSFIPSSCFGYKKVALRHDIANKIKELNETMNDLKIQRDTFNFDVRMTNNEQHERPITTSQIDLTKVRGRQTEKEKIKNLLLSESGQTLNIQTISIVGMGGIGKTTLAQFAFNDNEVKACFDKTIWVPVSKPFAPKRIAQAIFESLSSRTETFSELQIIVDQIKEIVSGKKFLLVLDDVWEDGPDEWGQLKRSLSGGLPGSKILVTTRSESVASNMGSARSCVCRIGKLPPEDCWSLFREVAFFDRDNEECEKLEKIGRQIVEKCDGLPLAAKVLGSLLRLKSSVNEWRKVLNSELWELPGIWEAKTGLASLWLSYYDLPSELRQCFLYCAIFPEDYEIQTHVLVEMWMAQGYLGATKKNVDMEIDGGEHFQTLCRRSFFQKFDLTCKMHDVLRDFSQYLMKQESLSLEINNCGETIEQSALCTEARHLRIVLDKDTSFPSSISTLKKLRSLWVQEKKNSGIGVALSNLFDELTCLRSLILSDCSITEIPDSIGKLMHLRLLDLSRNLNLKMLPESLCELYNLQTLDVSVCGDVVLPESIWKLVNLRHLHNKWNRCPFLPKGVGRLSNLRTLEEFNIGNGATENECSLGDLTNLDQLQGSLRLEGLENVHEEVKEKPLAKKIQLTTLLLDFGGEETEGRRHHDEELMEALHPSTNLEELVIWGYQGAKFSPSWFMSLINLTELSLECIHCEQLPPLWKFPSLVRLELNNMTSVVKLDAGFVGMRTQLNNEISSSTSEVVAFPKLESLSFSYMPNWIDWDDVMISPKFKVMPNLRSLSLAACKSLRALPNYMYHLSLDETDIGGCDRLLLRPPYKHKT